MDDVLGVSSSPWVWIGVGVAVALGLGFNFLFDHLAKRARDRARANAILSGSIVPDQPFELTGVADRSALTLYIELDVRGPGLDSPSGGSGVIIGQEFGLRLAYEVWLDQQRAANGDAVRPRTEQKIGRAASTWGRKGRISCTSPVCGFSAHAGQRVTVRGTVSLLPDNEAASLLVFVA